MCMIDGICNHPHRSRFKATGNRTTLSRLQKHCLERQGNRMTGIVLFQGKPGLYTTLATLATLSFHRYFCPVQGVLGVVVVLQRVL